MSMSQVQKYRFEESYRSLLVGQILIAPPGETVRELKVRVARFLRSARAGALIRGAIMDPVCKPCSGSGMVSEFDLPCPACAGTGSL